METGIVLAAYLGVRRRVKWDDEPSKIEDKAFSASPRIPE